MRQDIKRQQWEQRLYALMENSAFSVARSWKTALKSGASRIALEGEEITAMLIHALGDFSLNQGRKSVDWEIQAQRLELYAQGLGLIERAQRTSGEIAAHILALSPEIIALRKLIPAKRRFETAAATCRAWKRNAKTSDWNDRAICSFCAFMYCLLGKADHRTSANLLSLGGKAARKGFPEINSEQLRGILRRFRSRNTAAYEEMIEEWSSLLPVRKDLPVQDD